MKSICKRLLRGVGVRERIKKDTLEEETRSIYGQL